MNTEARVDFLVHGLVWYEKYLAKCDKNSMVHTTAGMMTWLEIQSAIDNYKNWLDTIVLEHPEVRNYVMKRMVAR